VGGSPADNVGIAAGDIILRMDGTTIYTIEDLVRELHKKRVGDKVRIFAISEGLQRQFDVTLSKMS